MPAPENFYIEARDALINACVEWQLSEANEPHANYDAQLEYREESIIACARVLVRLKDKELNV